MLGLGHIAQVMVFLVKADDAVILLVERGVNGESLLVREDDMIRMVLQVVQKLATKFQTEVLMF